VAAVGGYAKLDIGLPASRLGGSDRGLILPESEN
jgi:hypothetical protein